VDANGNFLQKGDTVTVIKELRVKESSPVVKIGTRDSRVRLMAGDHHIDGNIDGIGAMSLKAESVRKSRCSGYC
jgi:protein PhnA